MIWRFRYIILLYRWRGTSRECLVNAWPVACAVRVSMGSGGVVVVVVVLAHLHLLSSVLDFWTRYERHQCNKCLTFRFFFFSFRNLHER